MLELKNAEYKYSRFYLHPITLKLSSGSFTSLLGPNGSGKTTLFSLITGLKKPHSGEILLNGKNLSRLKDKERAKLVGTVSQTGWINFDHKVQDVLEMGRFPYKNFFSGKSYTDRQAIEDVIYRLELETYRNRFIKTLSGGEYQRVLIARTLVQQTKIILLDEPGNHLDLKHQTILLNILKEEASRGKIIIAVLHDINQALFYSDQCLLLNNGEITGLGKPSVILTPEKVQQVFETKLSLYYNKSGNSLLGPS